MLISDLYGYHWEWKQLEKAHYWQKHCIFIQKFALNICSVAESMFSVI